MKIPELLSLIDELVSNDELTKSQKKSLASQIKKQYAITLRDLRYKGKEISIGNLRSLIKPLIENYESVKDLNSINEILQTMTEDLDTAYIPSQREGIGIDKEKEKLYAVILGNPGTNIDGMSSEYISKIIRRKLTEEHGINRDDIMNVLTMQSKNMYLNIEEYQKLINDSIIDYLSTNPNGDKFSNPKVFDVFQSLASSYKIQGNFDKVKEIYEQALRIKTLADTPQYRDLKNNYEKFLEFLEMKSDFDDKKFDSFEDLMKSLTVKFTGDDIFTKGTKGISPNPSPNPPQDSYAMPVEKKLEGLRRLVRSLRRDDEEYDIVECEVGKDAYEGYVILKIENANVSLFENFNEENARIYIVKNEMIDQVKPLAKNDAGDLDGVERVNHTEDFGGYCKRLISKTKKLIRETQVGIRPLDDDEIVFDSDLLDIPPEDEPPAQGNEENGDISQEDEQPIQGDDGDKDIPLDMVEAERRKAHENRVKLEKMEQKLVEIQENTDKKIENVQNQNEHSQD